MNFSKVDMDELLVILEKASSKQIKSTKTFKIAIHNIRAGHSDWALQELNSSKVLLEDTIGHHSDLLETIKFRPNVMGESTATKLKGNEALGTQINESWIQAREPSEGKRDTDKPRYRRSGADDREEDSDEDEAREGARSQKNLKLSSHDSIKPAPANERFTQSEMEHWLEPANS
jgi:hypothetical protein